MGIKTPNPLEFENAWSALNISERNLAMETGMEKALEVYHQLRPVLIMTACTVSMAAAMLSLGTTLGGPVGAFLAASKGIPAGFLMCTIITQQLQDHGKFGGKFEKPDVEPDKVKPADDFDF